MGRAKAGRRPRGGLTRHGRSSLAIPEVARRVGCNLDEVLGRFSDALALVTVVRRSLSARQSILIADEEIALRHAIEALQAVYNELDATVALIQAVPTAGPVPPAHTPP